MENDEKCEFNLPVEVEGWNVPSWRISMVCPTSFVLLNFKIQYSSYIVCYDAEKNLILNCLHHHYEELFQKTLTCTKYFSNLAQKVSTQI